jgi:hypothetical protein
LNRTPEEDDDEVEVGVEDESKDENVGIAVLGCPSARSPGARPPWALAPTEQPLTTIKANANLGRSLCNKGRGPIDFDCEVMIF